MSWNNLFYLHLKLRLQTSLFLSHERAEGLPVLAEIAYSFSHQQTHFVVKAI